MHLHILGICGTFMGGVALIARELGHRVSGSDAAVYPPMSDQLAASGIGLMEGYRAEHLDPRPDVVVIGNALSRGNAAIEHVLDAGIPYVSGPQWLAERVLATRRVVAVAGTHGKTTTASMTAWILEDAGLAPGFLIGGVPGNFGVSARLGSGACFVVEADEYDTAFFDKRAKFVHYRPRIAVLNNLEYDHADIYPDLASIERQFHHLVRTVPRSGRIVRPLEDAALDRVLAMGCWTVMETVSADDADATFGARALTPDASRFAVRVEGRDAGVVEWPLAGAHNVANALSAIAAARACGVAPEQAVEALSRFAGVKRRLEVRGVVQGVTVYDDFAHHPTAIAATLGALRARIGAARLVAVSEPRSNTMKLGIHREDLAPSFAQADRVFVYRPEGLTWDLDAALAPLGARVSVHADFERLVADVLGELRPGDHVLVMSNGGFGGIHARLLAALGR